MTEQDVDIFIGEDKTIPVVLFDTDKKPRACTGFTITAALRSLAETAVQNGSTVTAADSGGSDYARGLVDIIFTDTNTLTMSVGRYQLEVNVIDGSSLVSKYVSDQIYKVRSKVL